MHSQLNVLQTHESTTRKIASRDQPFRAAISFALGLLVCLIVALSGCSKNSALVGKWQGDKESVITEFHADGTFKIVGEAGGEEMKGTYSFNGERLELKIDGDVGKTMGTISARVKVEGDTMKLTDPKNGKVETLKRVKQEANRGF